MADPEGTFAVNVKATHVLVEALGRHPVERLVFASTLDVYGTGDVVHREDESPAPVNVYGLSKLLGEQLVEHATRCGGCRTGWRAPGQRLRSRRDDPHLVPDA